MGRAGRWAKTTVTTEGVQKLPHNQQTAHRRKNLTRLGYAPMSYNPATPSLCPGIGQSVQNPSTMQPIPKKSAIQSMQKQSAMQSTEQPMKQQLAAQQGQPQPDAQATQRHRQTRHAIPLKETSCAISRATNEKGAQWPIHATANRCASNANVFIILRCNPYKGNYPSNRYKCSQPQGNQISKQ